MKLFTPPNSAYTDTYERAKFRFVWRIFIFLCFVFSGLSLLHLIKRDPDIYITLSALFAMVLSLIVTYKTGRYTFAAVLGGFAGSLLNQLDLFFIVGSQKFVTILWIISITLYVFYLLGSKWGLVTLIINITGVTLSLFLVPKEVMIERVQNLSVEKLISIVINLIVITYFIAYLMHQILKTSKKAAEESKNAQNALRVQYEIARANNEEKTVMLREIHHRVKNNLQVITSLLRLQSNDIDDEQTREHFQEAINRVAAMALIHEKMYGSQDLAKINLKSYLNSLAHDILDTYSTSTAITINISSTVEHVQPKSLVSTALIFNELITNSIKHGFENRQMGEINIEIDQPSSGILKIIYRDDGQWKESTRKNSFGLELIDTFTKQIDGDYEFSKTEGTRYTFTFQLDEKTSLNLASLDNDKNYAK